jgi:hypothetical protein
VYSCLSVLEDDIYYGDIEILMFLNEFYSVGVRFGVKNIVTCLLKIFDDINREKFMVF